MKKATLDMLIGKRTRCHFRRNIPKTTILRTQLPVGQATKKPPLSSILGQYGLNTDAFCDLFNKNSISLWMVGTLIPVVILISPSKTYLIEYRLPTVFSLFEHVFKFRTIKWTHFYKSINRKLLIAHAYKIAILKAGTTNRREIYIWFSQILGTIYSMNVFEFDRLIKAKFNYKKKKKE